jgi:ABC-type transport system involved in multi-copper enzyme maturation permease subunit
MTAQTTTSVAVAPRSADRPLAGLGALVRKDVTEWVRGRRAWIVAILTTVFMVLTAANGWITATIAANVPSEAEVPEVGSQLPLDNLLTAVGAQIWVMAAIFAVGSLIVVERQSGTLSWVASKPVSRGTIWMSKWITASAMLMVSAVLVPMIVTVATVTALYGAPSIPMVVGLVLGMFAVIAFFAAVGLAAGTFLPGQPAVIAVGFGVLAVTPIVSAILPFDVEPFLPTSMLTWTAAVFTGGPVSIVTPVAYVVVTGAVVALALHRMNRMEL